MMTLRPQTLLLLFAGLAGTLATTRGANATSEPAAPTERVMFLSAPEGAEIWLDGVALGKSPVSRTDVAPGPHEVVFRLAGHDELREAISVDGRSEQLILRRLKEAALQEPDTYRDRWRTHLSAWALGLGIGYLRADPKPATLMRTGIDGGGGFSMDIFGQASLIVFGGDATFSPFSDSMPVVDQTSGGPITTTVRGLSLSAYAGPTIPLLNKPAVYLGLYGGYAAFPNGVTRGADPPDGVTCIGCTHDHYPIAGGPFGELNVFLRHRGFGVSSGYRRLLAPGSDMTSMFSIKLHVYMDRQVASWLNSLGRKP